MTERSFSIKELMAAGKISDAIAHAMCPEMLQTPKHLGGQNMEAREAERTAALVSLGRKSVIFRHANDLSERAGAIEELYPILYEAKDRRGRSIAPFSESWIRCIAGAALEELRDDKCIECHGAGQVPMTNQAVEGRQPMMICGKCGGGLLRKNFSEDSRIARLTAEWLKLYPPHPDDSEAPTAVAQMMRGHRRLNTLIFAIEFAKGKLLEAERIASEQAAKMLERWK